jgi:hypothetical protein
VLAACALFVSVTVAANASPHQDRDGNNKSSVSHTPCALRFLRQPNNPIAPKTVAQNYPVHLIKRVGGDLRGTTPAEMHEIVARQVAFWTKISKDVNIQPQ